MFLGSALSVAADMMRAMSRPRPNYSTEPEFVSTLELHMRDRLPGIYVIAGEVAYYFILEEEYLLSHVWVGDLSTGIGVEIPATMLPPRLYHRTLQGAWVVVHGYAQIIQDRRSLIATEFDVVARPPSPDEMLDPDWLDDE